MAVVTFDRVRFANTLKAAGVPDKQAEAQAIAFAEVVHVNLKDLATKDDLGALKSELKQDMAALKTELKQDMAALKTELKQDMAALKSELDATEQRLGSRIDMVSAEIKQLRTEIKGVLTLLKLMFGVGVTVGVGILIRLFLFRSPI